MKTDAEFVEGEGVMWIHLAEVLGSEGLFWTQ
jgi:hypothetical protein